MTQSIFKYNFLNHKVPIALYTKNKLNILLTISFGNVLYWMKFVFQVLPLLFLPHYIYILKNIVLCTTYIKALVKLSFYTCVNQNHQNYKTTVIESYYELLTHFQGAASVELHMFD